MRLLARSAAVLLVAAATASALPVVAIDAGHGGTDTGAVGVLPPGTVTGLPARSDVQGRTLIYEKDVTLDVAQRVNQALVQRGYATLMTRTTDAGAGDVPFPGTSVDLKRRTSMANAAGASIFVSIHENALSDTSSGTETYQFYVNTPAAMALATAVHQEVVIRMGLPDRGIKRAGFYVLKHTEMPSVLVEGAFLSNPAEALYLAQPEVRQALADGITIGIDRYAHGNTIPTGQYGPSATTPAPLPAPIPLIRYWVSGGTFRTPAQANRLRVRLRKHRINAVVRGRYVPHAGRRLYLVVAGRYVDLDNARLRRDELRRLGLPARVWPAAVPPPPL